MLTWNLADLFEGVVDAVGGNEAVVSDPVRLTFAELDERANRLVSALAERGVGPGDNVALVLRNGHEYLEAMLASFKLRAVPINVNTRYTAEEIAYILGETRPPVVIHESDLDDRVRAASTEAGLTVDLIQRGAPYEAALAAGSPRRRRVERSGDDRYLLYTGGTTGLPKGVIWRHEDLLFAALGGGNPGGDPVSTPAEVVERARTGRTRCLPASPFTHGTAHWTALSTLLAGGTVIVDTGRNFHAERMWALAEEESASILVIVGDAFGRPLADALSDVPERWDLGELVVILSGGAILSPVVRQTLLEHLPWTVVVDGYGTSETGGQGQMPVWAGQEQASLPRFHVDEDTAVLDDAGRPAPPGSGLIGRLARKGHIPVGYLGDQAATSETFTVVGGHRWAIPGDLARVEGDGSVTLLGRGSSSINSGGEKVFPEEVEMALKAHPDVFDAVVVGVPDDRFGERVAAVVQARSGHVVDPATLRDHCRSCLADFKIPRRIDVVDLVQRRPSGKADLAWAKARLGAGPSRPAPAE